MAASIPGEKPYKCLQCLKSFVSSGVLKSHIRTHTGVKTYKCLICDTMFTTNGSLKRHMSTHSEVRPFMCPYCQKTFKTSVNCKKHMKTHKQELAIQALQQQQEADLGGDQPQEVTDAEVTIDTEIADGNESVEQVENGNDGSDTVVMQEVQTQIEVTNAAELTQVCYSFSHWAIRSVYIAPVRSAV